MDPAISSNILRQSQYFLAIGKSLKHRSAYFQSTSQRATIFSEDIPLRFTCPLPPIPTPAILSLSLGALWPKPLMTPEGIIVIPAEMRPAFLIKLLLVLTESAILSDL